MTDLLLCLILAISILNWAEHSEWVALRLRRARKLQRRLGKKIKNWKHSRSRRIDG